MNRELTSFQILASARIQALLEERHLQGTLEAIRGRRETFLRARIPLGKQSVDVYLYDNEAGYMLGNEWRLFEHPDYEGSIELLAAFEEELGGLLDRLSRAPPSGRTP